LTKHYLNAPVRYGSFTDVASRTNTIYNAMLGGAPELGSVKTQT